MSNDRIGFIKKEIEKSGFPLEIEVSNILKERGWDVYPSSPFFDEDEEKWREIDVKAYKSARSLSGNKSIVPLAVLASSMLAYGMGMLIIIAISSIGMTRRVFEINIISFLGGGLSCALLIPVLGINGAAIGRSLLFILMLGYGVYSAKKIMKVHFDSQALSKSLLSSALMALLLVAFQTFHASVLLLPFYIMVGGSTYALSLRALNAVDTHDLMILKGILPKRLAILMKPVDKLYA